jgi:hypothetical protein
MANLRQSSEWQHHFGASGASGMATSRGGSVAPGMTNPYRTGNFTEALVLETQNPELAKQLKAESWLLLFRITRAGTFLSDIVTRPEFLSYVAEAIYEQSAMLRSGAVVRDAALDARAGGVKVEVPTWKPISPKLKSGLKVTAPGEPVPRLSDSSEDHSWQANCSDPASWLCLCRRRPQPSGFRR